MPAPSTPSGFSGAITGNARFRQGLLGRMILQMECRPYSPDSAMGEPEPIWQDAPAWALRHIRYHRERRGLLPLI